MSPDDSSIVQNKYIDIDIGIYMYIERDSLSVYVSNLTKHSRCKIIMNRQYILYIYSYILLRFGRCARLSVVSERCDAKQ